MMPISPENYLHCNSDGWISVRSANGALLGCIPGAPPQEDWLFAPPPLGNIEVRAALIYCLVPTAEQLSFLHCWPGFVPVSPGPKAALPVAADDQSDLGKAP
jgi:hypothetical protein